MEVPPGRELLEDLKEPGEEQPSSRPQGQRRPGPCRWGRLRRQSYLRPRLIHSLRRLAQRTDSLERTQVTVTLPRRETRAALVVAWSSSGSANPPC